MPVVLVPQHARLGQGFSVAARATALEHAGRRTNGTQSAASWVADLTDLRKVILLCGWCRAKFNPRKHGYRRFYIPDHTGKTDGYQHNGRCDACKAPTIDTPGGGTAYIHEVGYATQCEDPTEAAHRARIRSVQAWRRQVLRDRLRSLMAAGTLGRLSALFHRRGSRRPLEAAARQGA